MLVAVKDGEVEVEVRGSGDLVVFVVSLGRGVGDFDILMGDLEARAIRRRREPSRHRRQLPRRDGLTLHDFAEDVARAIEHLSGRAGPCRGPRIRQPHRALPCRRPSGAGPQRNAGRRRGTGPAGSGDRAALMRIFELDRSEEERSRRYSARVLFARTRPFDLARRLVAGDEEDAMGRPRLVPYAEWGHAGSAPVLVLQGLDDPMAIPENGYVLREQLGAGPGPSRRSAERQPRDAAGAARGHRPRAARFRPATLGQRH